MKYSVKIEKSDEQRQIIDCDIMNFNIEKKDLFFCEIIFNEPKLDKVKIYGVDEENAFYCALTYISQFAV